VEKGLSGVGSKDEPPQFLIVGPVWFDSVESFQSAFAPVQDAILGDVQNYTKIAPTFMISEVVVDRTSVVPERIPARLGS